MYFVSRFMFISLLFFTIMTPRTMLGQQDPAFPQVYEQAYAGGFDRLPDVAVDTDADGKKSGFAGVAYSLLLPGMGELYADRFDRGKYPFVTEIALWIGALGINSYGNWVQDDARLFARQHAGVDPTGKSDDFFVNIENYSDIHDFNNQRLNERRTDELYPDEPAWQWAWDTDANRKEYKDQRIHADEMHNAVTFFILGMIANRIWSAIQAAASVRQYNASLEERLTSMPSMQPRLRSWAGKVDGMELQFSW
ncbi:MAG: hypothetical protein IH600_03050 [Bacteroidetes bacterium]|nr:hypothetical protein [Bacteroidota bacterium]